MINFSPKVSVCIPTYNRGELLREAIQSVLAQTLHEFELIISDNASHDHTRAVVNSFSDKRIRYIRHNKTLAPVGNFNHCLAVARGAYVTLFHDDDIMLPDNLLLKAQALDHNPGVGLVHSQFHVIDEDGTILQYNTNWGQNHSCDVVERGHDFLRRNLLGNNEVNPPSVLIRKECYNKLGGISEKLSYASDWEYWLRISLYYDVMFLATPLLKYRRHPGAGTSRYTTVVDRCLVTNLFGLVQEFSAKRITLEHSKNVVEDWSGLRNGLQRHVRTQIMNYLQGPLVEQSQNSGLRQSVIQLFMNFPELLWEKPGIDLLLRSVLGPWAARTAKAIMHFFRRIAI